FINLTLKPSTFQNLFSEINQDKDEFPKFPRKNEIASIEYVSANPTGYLHIGHGRNAMFGEVASRLYDKVGYDVIRDYVVNDAGNQMNILASSVLVRYLQNYGVSIELPEDSYHGEEIIFVANKLKEKFGDKFLNLKISNEFLIEDENARFEIRWFARNILLDQIKEDLAKLDIYIDEYFSEQSTHDEPKKIENILTKLEKSIYKQDGAVWFRSTDYLDDKDRVLIKSNGSMTYFLPDIYYHNYKLTRSPNITQAVIILGSDHYGYTNRVKAVLRALGHDDIDNKYKFLFIQMVKLTKNGQEFKMSKRSGQSLVLSDLIDLLGKEITKWNLISASNNNHLEIDIEEVVKEDSNNSYYYIKYSNIRATKLLEKMNFTFKENLNYDCLNSEIERNLINTLQFYKQTIIYTFKNLDIQKLKPEFFHYLVC
ncbi:MAG: arginine--tRNA ligase, partial [Ureaplasma sp.]|nr:arginine--tRNA ligase [Ureaplasma sp.]